MVSASLSRSGGLGLQVRCLVTNNDVVNYRPRLCSSGILDRFLPTLNPHMMVFGDRGYLSAPARRLSTPARAKAGRGL
jgi:hypothetical protein